MKIKFNSKKTIIIFLITSLLIFLTFSAALFISETKFRKFTGDSTFAKKHSERVLGKCIVRQDWQDCYGKEFASLTLDYPLEDVFKILDEVQIVDEKMRDCHFVGHAIAASLARLDKNGDPRNWQKSLKSLGLRCQAGLIHGIIEAMSLNKTNFSVTPSLIDEVCTEMGKNVPTDSYYAEQLCAHGMGHIVLVYNLGDLDKSIKVCSQSSSRLQFLCHSGVFMENIERKNLEAHNIAKRIDYTAQTIQVQESICGKYSGIVAKACWMEIGHMYTGFAQNDLSKIQTLCKAAPQQDFQDECYFQGATIVALEPALTNEQMSRLCSPMESDRKKMETCIDRIILVLIYNSVRYEERARKFCNLVPESEKQYCFDLIDNRLKAAVSFEFNKL